MKKIFIIIISVTLMVILSVQVFAFQEAPFQADSVENLFNAISEHIRGENNDYRLDNMTEVIVPTLSLEEFEIRCVESYSAYWNVEECLYYFYPSNVPEGEEDNAKDNERMIISVDKRKNSFLEESYAEKHEKINNNVYKYVDETDHTPVWNFWYVNIDSHCVVIRVPVEIGCDNFQTLKELVRFDIYEITESGATKRDYIVPGDDPSDLVETSDDTTTAMNDVTNPNGCSSTLVGIAIIPTALAAGLVVFKKRKK